MALTIWSSSSDDEESSISAPALKSFKSSSSSKSVTLSSSYSSLSSSSEICDKSNDKPVPLLGLKMILGPDWIFNWFILSKYSEIALFGIKIPQDIIRYIMSIYVDAKTKTINEDIDQMNICRCENEECIIDFYRLAGDRNIKETWDLYHCSNEDCHTITNYNDYDSTDDNSDDDFNSLRACTNRFSNDSYIDGFVCTICCLIYCDDCYTKDCWASPNTCCICRKKSGTSSESEESEDESESSDK